MFYPTLVTPSRTWPPSHARWGFLGSSISTGHAQKPPRSLPGKLVFGHIESIKIPVILNPAGYMLTSSGFAYIYLEVYSIDSSQMISKFPEVLNLNRLFLELNRFICNYPPVLPGLRFPYAFSSARVVIVTCKMFSKMSMVSHIVLVLAYFESIEKLSCFKEQIAIAK